MKNTFITILAFCSTLASCSSDPSLNIEELPSGITARVEAFTQATKATINENLDFKWQVGDTIGVVPTDAYSYQTNYEVTSVGADPNTASFDGGAWKLNKTFPI